MAAGAKWYIVQAYSGYEKKVAEAIKASAELHGLEALIEEVLVPVEEVVEVKKGKKVTKVSIKKMMEAGVKRLPITLEQIVGKVLFEDIGYKEIDSKVIDSKEIRKKRTI